jgi:hypothetical protein
MNKKIKYISGLLLSAMIMFTACEENEYSYDSFDPAKDKTAQTVLLSQPNITVAVDPNETTTTVVIGVQLWGSLSKEDIVIPFVVDSTTMDASWYTIAGGGFVIPAGQNAGTLSMSIVNASIPGGYFSLYYKLGEVAGVSVNDNAKIGRIDAFSPGELWPFMGTFTGDAASLGSPGAWDEVWTAVVVLNREDPNSIDIYGIGGKNTGKALVGTIDLDAETITFVGGQNVGNPYGYGDSFVYYATPPWSPTMDPLVGEIDATARTFTIPNLGITTGPYYWDVFNCIKFDTILLLISNIHPTR